MILHDKPSKHFLLKQNSLLDIDEDYSFLIRYSEDSKTINNWKIVNFFF